jgi:hypothetical protein
MPSLKPITPPKTLVPPDPSTRPEEPRGKVAVFARFLIHSALPGGSEQDRRPINLLQLDTLTV